MQRVLKHRLLKEDYQTVTNCNAFKLHASDGKMRQTDVANTEQQTRPQHHFKIKTCDHLLPDKTGEKLK